MADVDVPSLSVHDPAAGDSLSSAVLDQRKYEEKLIAARAKWQAIMEGVKARMEKDTVKIPPVSLDDDITRAYKAGLISFDHACLSQIVRNTAEKADGSDGNGEGENSQRSGDAAGSAATSEKQPQEDDTATQPSRPGDG